MKYRALDSKGDYRFGHGNQDFLVDSPAAVAQAIKTRLRLFQGEWFLNLEAGVPWLSKVVGYSTRPFYDAVIRGAILGTQDVVEILSYSSELDTTTRGLLVHVTVSTSFGPTSTISITTFIPLSGTAGQVLIGGGYGVGAYGDRGYGQ